MLILGVDPGIGRAGWGIINFEKGKTNALDYGCFETTTKDDDSQRLVKIYNHFTHLIKKHKPDSLSIEELFFAANTTTAFRVGQARGVVILAAAQKKLDVTSYTPLQVKLAVTGYGKAEKSQVGQMVKAILKLDKIPKPDDTTDALAIALTHAFSSKMGSLK